MADLKNNKVGRPLYEEQYDIDNPLNKKFANTILENYSEKRAEIIKRLTESGKNTLTREVLFEKYKKLDRTSIKAKKEKILNNLSLSVDKYTLDEYSWGGPTPHDYDNYINLGELNDDNANYLAICELF